MPTLSLNAVEFFLLLCLFKPMTGKEAKPKTVTEKETERDSHLDPAP